MRNIPLLRSESYRKSTDDSTDFSEDFRHKTKRPRLFEFRTYKYDTVKNDRNSEPFNRKIRYKKSGKPDSRSLRPHPSLSSDTMPIDENERRTKVLKKFARDINSKYTDKYTSDEDPRSIQRFYQTRSMKNSHEATVAATPIKNESKQFDATDFNCEFSKKVSYFEYGPKGVSKKDMVSKFRTYNSTNIIKKVQPSHNGVKTKTDESITNTANNNSKSYSSSIITKVEATVKNCDVENCGSHFEANRE